MSQRDLEFKILAGIVPTHTLRMERAHLRLISEDNFNEPNFKILWSHLNAYYDDHMAVMPEWVLKEHLDRANLSEAKKLAIVEIYKFLASNVVSDHEFDESIRLLKDAEITRKTDESIVTAREILNGQYYDENGERVLKGQEEARSYLSEALQQLETVDGDFAPEGDVSDDLEKIWSQYLQKESNPEEHAGILYGIEELDECTGGVRAGELVLLAGFTGSGKSQMLTNLAWNAMRNGHNVIMFTTETTREEMEIRLLARHSRLPKFKLPGGLDSHQIMSGTLSESHRTVFREVLDDFKAGQPGGLIMVQMPANGYVDYVHAKANQYNRNTPIDLVLIDSINLLRASRRYDSKREMLEDLLQGFKRFASSFDNGRGVAVVSPWQMSRPAWKEASEAGGVYTLASLADTSEAEKSQPLDAKVLTPKGFINMGDTEVGMTIIGSDGGTQTIEAVTENGMRDILEVVLNDGSFTRCSPNHLWTVMGDGGVPITMTAQEIMESGKSFQVPVMDNQPEFHTENNIVGNVFNPTIMGHFLQASRVIEGSVTLTTSDLSRVTKGFPVVPDYSLVETIDGSVVYSLSYYRPGFKEYKYIDTLDEANLFCGDSSRFRIPLCYLEGSHHIREALVRTFMKNPKANLHSSKVPYKELADLPYDHPGYGAELKYLVWSLGWSTQPESRKIVRVVNTGNVEPVRCITVSNPDGLYVTDDFIITHNSSSQIITIFKEDSPSSSQLNIQVLKNRSGPEMPKVSYPYDYRNSFIGASGDSSSTPKANNSAASVKQDIGNIIGL